MSKRQNRDLPVVGRATEPDPPDEVPSCSPSVFVTNEEASLLATMRSLQERAAKLREVMGDCTSNDERTTLQDELEELRARRAELVRRRDKAYRRKMVMLGHLPPDALLD